MTILHLDFETYSEAGYTYDPGLERWLPPPGSTQGGLPAVGAAVYAEHPSTEVLIACYAFPGGPVHTWAPGYPEPSALLEHVRAGGLVSAHNSMFEWLIWDRVCVRRYGWPRLPLGNTRDTAALVRAYGLPGKLANAAAALGLAQQKDTAGGALIRRFSVPCKPRKTDRRLRRYMGDDPDNAYKFYAYCAQDVRTEEALTQHAPPLSPLELEVWKLDQQVNERGVAVDVEAVRACQRIVSQLTEKLTAELRYVTNGRIQTSGQLAEIQQMFADYGILVPNMQADTITGILGDTGHPIHAHPWARRVLEIRQALASASVKKLAAIERQLCADGRVRGLFMYYGAERTGRWAGRGPQPQNLPRGNAAVAKCTECAALQGAGQQCYRCFGPLERVKWNFDVALAALESFQVEGQWLEAIEARWGDVLGTMAGTLRSLFVAAPGHDLIAADYSAIEAVVLAALAGEQWRLDVFRTHGKIYEMSASKITGVPLEEYLAYRERTGEHHPHRQAIGKIAELACFGADTELLTDSGWKRIVDVKTEDKLHDGVDWIDHGGVVNRGSRLTTTLCGVRVTPGHKFHVGGDQWATTDALLRNTRTLNLALGTASSLLWSASSGEITGTLDACVLAETSVRRLSVTYAPAGPRGVTRVQKRSRRNRVRGTEMRAPTAGIESGCLDESLRPSNDVRIQRTGNTPSTAVVGSRCTQSGLRIEESGSRTCVLSRGGMTLDPHLIGSTTTVGTRRGTSASCLIENSRTTSDRRCGWSTRGRNFRRQSFTGALLRTSLTPTRSSMLFDVERLRKRSLNGRLVEVFDVINAGPRSRFVIRTAAGPLIAHNSGYGGGLGAWKAFGAGEHMDDETIAANVKRWRQESPAIVSFWYGLQRAAVSAIENPGYTFAHREISYHCDGRVLRCTLPSGRCLVYHAPRVADDVTPWGAPTKQIFFTGWNSNPKYGPVGWIEQRTYGGRLTENVVQAVARDIMASGMLNVAGAGYNIVLHVHDEIVCEQPGGHGSVDELERLMSALPSWAAGWPVRARGWRGQHYRKD